MRMAFISLLFGLLCAEGRAELRPESQTWSDISKFAEAASKRNLTVRSAHALQTALASPQSASLLLAPTCTRESGHALSRYVRQGGRILIAAEDDRSLACLRPFGASLAALTSAIQSSTSHPQLHLVKVSGPKPLAMGTHVLSNRANRLTVKGESDTILNYGDGSIAGVRIRHGAGTAIILGDSSLFINLMRPQLDNAKFVDGLVDWLVSGGPAFVWVVGPDTPWNTTPPNTDARARSAKPSANQRFAQWVKSELVLLVFCVLLGVGLLTGCLRFLGPLLLQQRRFDLPWALPRTPLTLDRTHHKTLDPITPDKQDDL